MDTAEINETKNIIRINKKTTSASLPDILNIIKNYEKKEDDSFWYIVFPAINSDLEELYELTNNWKTTRLWIQGKEIPNKLRWGIRDIVFCIYREKCEGQCMRDLRMNLYSYNYDDILIMEKMGENESIGGLKKWFENMSEERGSEDTHYFRERLRKFLDSQIIQIEDNKNVILNKELLKKTVKKLYELELEYCPIIEEDNTIDIIEQFPNTTALPERIQRELEIERDTEETEVEDDEEWEQKIEDEYLQKQARMFGDEVEKRFRKVLSEFFEKKN